MSALDWLDALAAEPAAPAAVTVGKFDGVHLGHRQIVAQLREIAVREGLETVVVTFDRNPLEVVRPELAPEPLTTTEHRIGLLHEAGVDRVVVIPFTREVAAVPAEEFARRVLFEGLNARVLLVGADFRFGAFGRGDVALLRALGEAAGVRVVTIDDICVADGRRVSSTWAREALALGRIRETTGMLGRHHRLRGTVVRGFQRGRQLGFPTANLGEPVEGFVPADGVYAAWADVDAGRFMAAVSVGDNPTFDGVERKTVEAYLLDVDLDLYDRPISLELVEFVRPMHRFADLDALIEQMRRDVQHTREVLGRESSGRDAAPPDVR